MIQRALGIAIFALCLLPGCADSKWALFKSSREGAKLGTDRPTAADLVGYLDENSRRIQSLQCMNLDIDIKQGLQQFHTYGKMICAKPRNFHMVAEVVGNTEADIGSNADEFWYWFKRSSPPYLVHCSYSDLAKGVQVPFPFQPEWVMEALGMAEYGKPELYRTQPGRGNTLELVREVQSQGQRVHKVTVFALAGSDVQVRSHQLRDARGKLICAAYIDDRQNIAGAIIPRKVHLVYPAEKLELKIKLFQDPRDVVLNQAFEAQQFARPTLPGVPTFDLARGREQGDPIRPAGGIMPR